MNRVMEAHLRLMATLPVRTHEQHPEVLPYNGAGVRRQVRAWQVRRIVALHGKVALEDIAVTVHMGVKKVREVVAKHCTKRCRP